MKNIVENITNKNLSEATKNLVEQLSLRVKSLVEAKKLEVIARLYPVTENSKYDGGKLLARAYNNISGSSKSFEQVAASHGYELDKSTHKTNTYVHPEGGQILHSNDAQATWVHTYPKSKDNRGTAGGYGPDALDKHLSKIHGTKNESLNLFNNLLQKPRLTKESFVSQLADKLGIISESLESFAKKKGFVKDPHPKDDFAGSTTHTYKHPNGSQITHYASSDNWEYSTPHKEQNLINIDSGKGLSSLHAKIKGSIKEEKGVPDKSHPFDDAAKEYGFVPTDAGRISTGKSIHTYDHPNSSASLKLMHDHETNAFSYIHTLGTSSDHGSSEIQLRNRLEKLHQKVAE